MYILNVLNHKGTERTRQNFISINKNGLSDTLGEQWFLNSKPHGLIGVWSKLLALSSHTQSRWQ